MTGRGESGSKGLPTTPPARKRRRSTDQAGRERAFKHRSSQACQSCRTRKVRCDVKANGSCCTNCRLDGLKCVVVASRRGKPNSHRDSTVEITYSPSQAARVTSNSVSRTTRDDGRTDQEARPTPGVLDGASHVPVCVTFDEDLDNAGGHQQPDYIARNGIDHAPSPSFDELLTPETGTTTLQQHQSPVGMPPLPSFITPLPSRILNEDVAFLAQKGAFTVPEPDMGIEILRGYLFSVHPFMPMLDFKAFVKALSVGPEDCSISLLLFQAVMFAGLHSLQLHIIHRLGFESTKQAREVFFNRVRLLYEFDVEPDSAAVLQSLILMSSWYSKWDERRHTWHWTGLAYDVARSMGLHRDPTTRYTSDKIQRFRRRLWWSLYIRDRMIALGTRRPMRIRDDDFDVAMLTLDDFDLEPLEDFVQGQPLIPSAEEVTSTALMCIQLAKLCICIGHVVSSQYTTLSTQPDVPHTMMVVPRRDGDRIEELESCDSELNEWFQALSTNVRRTDTSTVHNGSHSCSEVHWGMLNITYLTALNVLHRARALQFLPDSVEAQTVQKSSRLKVKDAARGLTRVSQTMLRYDQVRYLGLIGVTALVAACLSHMLDVSSGDDDVRDASTFRLCQSLQVLQSLRGIYASADAAVSFLASATRKAGISLSVQVDGPVTAFTSVSAHGVASPSTSAQQSTAYKDSAGSSSGLPCEPFDIPRAGCPVISLQGLTRSADDHTRHQSLTSGNGQILDTTSSTQPIPRTVAVSPSAVALATSNDAPMSSQFQLVDTTLGGLSDFAANGAFSDWRNDMATDIGLEPLSFNYDFYSDAFGFLDGHLQGI
ncbi:hypothetical protein LTR37_016677 [Vermiconidia calcicola]|uniref:Uncharacterized protein n=1 Tax=Vermiconidia calcicola TaxID=1690605 RepID=A0ACC3MMB3_9PEZI|nr:hypothetical protein LTR37_016677 [Vermiconidia calcicola]